MSVLLLVDDEEDLRELLREALEAEGVTVHTAAEGRAALALLNDGVQPDLILLDLMMPGMNGWDVFAAIQQIPHLATIPIVIATSTPDLAPKSATAVLKKPFSVGDITRLLAEAGR